MAKPLLLYGNGRVAESVCYFLTHDAGRTVAAFTVEKPFITAPQLLGRPVVPFDVLAGRYPPQDYDMFVAVGHVHVNRVRAAAYEAARGLGYTLISYLSSRAVTWPDLLHGDNTKIGTLASISPFVTLGRNIIVGGGSSIGHHAEIGDHVSIGPRAVLAGTVTVEPFCLIGANATIRDRVRLARGTVVGAGAVILEDTVENGVYAAPAAERLPVSSDRLQLG